MSAISADIPLVVSVGEPAGIGMDVILLAWHKQVIGEISPLPPFVLLGDAEVIAARSKTLGLSTNFQVFEDLDANTGTWKPDQFRVLKLKNRLSGLPGKPNAADTVGIIEAISTGVDLARAKKARGIVTLPINKKSLYDTGFRYPGHTEFLGALSRLGPNSAETSRPVMMMAGPELRTVPVTIHIPLKDVPACLTRKAIVETVQITARDMVRRFDITNPRIAVCGLNPHAGEGGVLGEEEGAIIVPAIAQLKREGIDCFGPLPADTMFHAFARQNYDVAVCMYHDQALIPAKALAFDETVNVTLGLAFIRTSPDHGTAFDIAGTGKANPASTIAAIKMADKMSRATGS